MKKILFFIAILLFSSKGLLGQETVKICQDSHDSPTKGRNVLFSPQTNEENIIRVYFDRMGNIYPEKELLEIDSAKFYHKNRKTKATLKAYFEDGGNNELKNLAQKLGCKADFESIQNKLFQRNADYINNVVDDYEQVVFFIHGYNNLQSEAEVSFNDFRNQFPSEKKILFVEVYWDGLTKKGGLGIWGEAQENTVYIGLGLRRLLNHVNSDIKISFLTHSSGASVATQALFTPLKWKNHKFNIKVDSLSKFYPTAPQKDINLYMIAPAIPGENTFKDIKNTKVNDDLSENTTYENISRIVIGYNEKDEALTKRILKHIGGKAKFGSTSLGANYKCEVLKTIVIINEKTPNIKVKSVNFSKKTLPKKHCVQSYVNAEEFEKIINLILN